MSLLQYNNYRDLGQDQESASWCLLFSYFITGDEIIIIAMNDSITSADENHNQPRNLFQEIHKINTDEWRPDELSFSPNLSFNSSFGHHEETSFSNDLPI